MQQAGTTTAGVLSEDSIENAMVVHAAFGGSTNLILHLPAIAHAAGLRRPTVADWQRVNRRVPRLDVWLGLRDGFATTTHAEQQD